MYTNFNELVTYIIERKDNNSDILKILKSPQQTRKIRQILSLNDDENISEKIYNIINPGISNKCQCGNEKKYVNINVGYRQFCSDRNCTYMRDHKKQATYDTHMKLHGCHPMKTKQTQDALKKSMIEKYGVENAVHISILNGTYSSPFSKEETKIKIKETFLIKYGGHPMQNEKCHENNLKSRVKFKEYFLPSGKSVNLQGYEDKGIEYLLSLYKEEDILYSVKEINEKLGIIRYENNNKTCRYYPDFYVISTNTIYEVKSGWTYRCNKKTNELKKSKCLELGFNFEFLIY